MKNRLCYVLYVAVCLMAVLPATLRAGAVVLPYANDGALKSILIVDNATDSDITFGFSTFRAHSATEFQGWAGSGVDIGAFVLPDSLSSYVEIQAPDGRSFLVQPLSALLVGGPYEALDLRSDRGYESFVILFSLAPAGASVRTYAGNQVSHQTLLTVVPGAPPMVKAAAGDTRISIATSSDGVFALAVRRNLATGEWIVLPLRKAGTF